jgi:hypothetical protein
MRPAALAHRSAEPPEGTVELLLSHYNMDERRRRTSAGFVNLRRAAHIGLAALCVVGTTLAIGSQGSVLFGLGIALYVVSLSFTLVLFGLQGQSDLLPAQHPLPQTDLGRLRRLVTVVAPIGFTILCFCGFVDGLAQSTGLLVLAAISLALWLYEAALFWRWSEVR